jgi:hypothetical protein
MREARRVTISVPNIALPMPPPSLPGAGGSWVNKLGRIKLPPLKRTYANTRNRGSTAMAAKVPEIALKKMLSLFLLRPGSKNRFPFFSWVEADGVKDEGAITD